MIRETLHHLLARKDFTPEEAEKVLEAILSPETTDGQIGALLAGFMLKGETADEITGFARVMRRHAVKLRTRRRAFLDTAGTGGGYHTFNISTAASLVVAGAGLPVAKHGNVAVTSRCGSADVLRALGVRVDAPAGIMELCFRKIGFAFMLAPLYHPALARVGKIRRELGVRTIFNLLGPLCCPAQAPFQIVGVYQESLTELMAGVLRNLGSRRAWVFHGIGGLDEFSLSDSTRVSEAQNGQVRTFYVTPEELGFRRSDIEELAGGDAEQNASTILGILKGDIRTARREVVVLNAAVGLFVAGRAPSIKAGAKMAREAIDSGAALRVLNKLRQITNSPEAFKKDQDIEAHKK